MEPPKSRKPMLSKRLGTGLRRSGISFIATRQPSRPTGRLIRKIQCQEAYSTSQPPSVGPASGPSRPGMVTKLSTRTKSWRG